MTSLFSTNEKIASLPPVVGVSLLNVLNKKGRASLFDIFDVLRTEYNQSPRSTYYAMMFLYSTGLIEFDGVYVRGVRNA